MKFACLLQLYTPPPAASKGKSSQNGHQENARLPTLATRRRCPTIPPVPPIVDIAGLDFAYGQQLVLKDINLPVERGSTLGVIGPNGGGKTTLLRLLLGQLHPTRGTILIDGLAPPQAVKRGDILGYLPQSFPLAEDLPLSVRQVIHTGLVGKAGLFKSVPKPDVEFADYLLDRTGLRDLAHRPIASISGGQRQRALIARALAPRPRVLLLDEPTTGIDRSGQSRFIEFLSDLKRELALTVILVTHDLQTVSAISDRIACLNVTLHYHDAPHRMPAELAHELFGCDLTAAGLGPRPQSDIGAPSP